jgi:tetratricopeptide (TPR) repeat protein
MALALACAAGTLYGQSVRSLVNGGNDLYREQKYTEAEVNYRKALEKEGALVQGHFNLGNALHQQGKFDDAVREFGAALEQADRPETRAYARYNIGNSLLRQEKYQDAVGSYVEALKLNPADADAKYNLSYALEKLRQPPQPQQKKNQQDKKNQDKQKQQQQQDQQQPQQKKDNQQQPQQSPQRQQAMSKPEAQRILDVLKNSERDVQKKLRARQAVRAKTDKDW